ncbi:MAG TPA: ABC transporter permease [Gemmatimonadales bacterium]|nr:ABC transporter permease [Gemmatimonadales bacterium]
MPLPPGLKRLFQLDADRRDPDIQAEIEFHLQTRIDQLTAQGKPASAAREQALREFGSPGDVAEQVRSIDAAARARRRRREWRSGFMQDLRYAWRGLWRSPLYTAVAAVTFALGIGANAAVFALLDAVVLRPLPFPGLDRLVRIYEHDTREERPFGQVTIADFRDWQSQSRSFGQMTAFRFRSLTLTGTEAVSLPGGQVTPEFFSVLGVRPLLGRDFRSGEGATGTPPVVVLSHSAWIRYFGADSGIVGRTIRLNDEATEVIGVLPPEFVDPIGAPDIWTVTDFDGIANDQGRSRRFHFLATFGRMREGVTLEQARQELETIGRRIAADFPDMNQGHLPQLVPLQLAGTNTARPVLWLVMGAVGLVLLIACANLANLVFARTLTRSRELAVRAALGAGRWRLVRQVLLEQLLLAAGGGLIGIAAATWSSGLFVRMLGPSLPRAGLVQIDGRVMGFTLLLAIIAATLSGLLPAIHAARSRLGDQLKTGSHGSTLTRRSHRVRAALVTLQVALATVLLVGSALALRSLRSLLNQELGFEPQSVWMFSAPAVGARYAGNAQALAFQSSLLERIRTLPGVRGASAAFGLPMANVSTTSIRPEGMILPPGPAPGVGYNAVEGEYFRVMGIPLLRGRLIEARDHRDAPPVAVINQALANRFWPGEDPIGKHFRSGPSPDAPPAEVIGVVADIRRRNLQLPPEPELYFALSQDISPFPNYVVRLSGDPAPALAAIRAALASLDAGIPMVNPQPLGEVVAGSLRQPRFLTALLSGMGGLALVLAAVGIYGVLAFLVTERRRELGVRLALGAGSGRIATETLRRGLVPVIAGLGLGLVGAILAGRLAHTLFFGVSATDPVALVAAILVLLLAATVGCLIPARRAARLDPVIALRD